MSNLSPEKEYDDPTSWISFCIEQMLKGVYTCLPGLIDSYDSLTKRAKIKIALTTLKTDGTEINYPVISDVPVLFQSTKTYIVQFPLNAGDPVLILFSQRGINNFKKTFEQASPDQTSFFSMHDAIAIPGFGSLSNTPAVSGAITIQTVDASTYIALSDDNVTIKASNITLDGNVTVTGDTTINQDLVVDQDVTAQNIVAENSLSAEQSFDIAGSVLPPDHVHGGVESGGSNTGTPIS